MLSHTPQIDAVRTQMGPFNRGEVEYIKTLAQVNGHKTYKATVHGNNNSYASTGTTWHSTSDTYGKYALLTFGKKPKVYNHVSMTAPADIVADQIDVFNVPLNVTEGAAAIDERASEACFLESVHAKLRLIQSIDADHSEYRMIVFRHKEKQSHVQQLAENFSNPLYDLFHNTNGYKIGPLGYRNLESISGDINYQSGAASMEDMITCMINKEDYMVMFDARMYLGKEYGGKHIYEKTFHWDHRDPMETPSADVTETENNKNYTWYMLILKTDNDASVTANPYLRIDCTTHVTSG